MKLLNNWLAALKYVPYWIITSKIIKNLFTALYADDKLL